MQGASSDRDGRVAMFVAVLGLAEAVDKRSSDPARVVTMAGAIRQRWRRMRPEDRAATLGWLREYGQMARSETKRLHARAASIFLNAEDLAAAAEGAGGAAGSQPGPRRHQGRGRPAMR
jgi:hypothetical protein